MGLRIISFTEQGLQLAQKIAETCACDMGSEDIAVAAKCSYIQSTESLFPVEFVEERIGEWTKKQMQAHHILLFIGACGIAVRAVAPCITDKRKDSPVLVADEKGKYIIPILSGHMGGANETACRIAEKIGAIPVITTATDINQKFAVDLFAKRNGLHVVNKDGIAKISAKVLAGREITISVEARHLLNPSECPSGIRFIPYPPIQTADVLITADKTETDALLLLRPKEYIIGMGCKKGKEADAIEELIHRTIKMAGIDEEQIVALASIEQKKNEEGFLSFSRKKRIPFYTFSSTQLQEVKGEFHVSDFVKEQVCVDNVCERAALAACGMDGKIILGKHAENGMTIAISKREWKVSFSEE